MESIPVNWDSLDSLVIDFAKSENLIEAPVSPCSSPPPSSPSSSYHSRLIVLQIRRSLVVGDIDAAIDLIRLHAPLLLDDHRLLFRLQKQKFIELLRRGAAEDRKSAIDCLRTDLAPCALHAYPEAYEEFKHVILALIYEKDDQTSPVANEWSDKRRFDIAGLMSSVLRAHLHAYDPVFSMALRYLISIHKGFCLRQGIVSPISDLTERLLLEERDPPATPRENLYEAPPFDEVDIQALAHAVELTRQGAVDSLRFARGDLFQAFQNELCRMKLDVSVVDELVREYCVYRGIVDSGFGSAPAFQMQSLSGVFSQPESRISVEMECGANREINGETSSTADLISTQDTDVEMRYPCDTTTSSHDDCSTSGVHMPENCRDVQRSKRHGTGERSRRKRWRGRHELYRLPNTPYGQSNVQDLKVATLVPSGDLLMEQAVEKFYSPGSMNNGEDKYEILLRMKELAGKGMAAEVVEEVNTMDPEFFVQNPVLLFQLKQVEFLKLVSLGDHSSALKVACSHLGPLAVKDQTLLQPLKETLLALLRPNEEAVGKGLPLFSLASSLQVAIGQKLGIQEPQLMKIMKATLHTHNEWFRLQRCKDRFESLLQINSMKEVSTSLLGGVASKSNIDSSAEGSSQSTVCSSNKASEDGSSPTQASSREVACDENAILKVMEFLALPRADAIHLLTQYNGNAESVIQQIFA